MDKAVPGLPGSPLPPLQPRRLRRTLHFDAPVFARLMEEVVTRAQQRLRAGAGLQARGHPLDWVGEGGSVSSSLWTRPVLEQHLRALLKAFLDAARPAGGLPLAADGLPDDVAGLLSAGVALSRAGAGAPKLERNIRAGLAVDHRLAEAALAFFRVFLERPQLRLDQIGARESERHRAVQRLQAQLQGAREALPARALEGMLLKANEAGTPAWAMTEVQVEYRGLRLLADAAGMARIALERVTRYRPVKLVDFHCPHRPVHHYEWYEWSRYADAALELSLLDAGGQRLRHWALPVRKQLLEPAGFVCFDMAPGQADDVEQLLAALAGAAAGRHPVVEVAWREQLLLNVADRDIVVSHCPILQLALQFDAAAHPDFLLDVGDAPGLVRDGHSWRLARPLLPREVLAVRIRWRGLRPEHALLAGAGGEIAWAALSAATPPPGTGRG